MRMMQTMTPFTFYLGTHHVDWLARAGVPLMVSRRRLAGRKTLPHAISPWMLDSGGYSELSLFGCWTITPARYARLADLYRVEVGHLAYAAPQDWMCEPHIVLKTGLSIAEHMRRTVQNYMDLRALAPHLPWMPVLQGFALDDYLRCLDLYTAAGIDLWAVPCVGVGTLCRRQGTQEARAILARLYGLGLPLHGFGFKITGLPDAMGALRSADSMAWSYAARREPPLPGCVRHKCCANCLRYALRWRERVLGLQARPVQLPLPL
jgi:hypothetical protein